MISKRSERSSVVRYSVPPSARVIDLAAVRMDSRSLLMSRSAESDAPMALSCSSRWTRSSAAVGAVPAAKRSAWVVSITAGSLDTDGAHFLDVGYAHQALLHAVLLQRAHAILEALGKHGRDARMLLDQLFQGVGGDKQFVQAAPALEAAAAALVAADRLVKRQLALVVAVELDPVLVDLLH